MDRFVCQRSAKIARLGLFVGMVSGLVVASPSLAHHPDAANHPVRPRIDVIPPLGNCLPSYRERYNRPTYLGGKIAYCIAPSSQEAMSWHRSVHRGYYANHAPRMEDYYLYPKPWEALVVGPRVPVGDSDRAAQPATDFEPPHLERNVEASQLAPEAEVLPTPSP